MRQHDWTSDLKQHRVNVCVEHSCVCGGGAEGVHLRPITE